MKKIKLFFLMMIFLLVLSSCAVIYPSLPNKKINTTCENSVIVYCCKESNIYKCSATINDNLTDEQVLSLEYVSLLEMKKILKVKGFENSFEVIIIKISDNKIEYLTDSEYDEERNYLIEQLSY
ncbi:MAG: hypothetical protein E7183_00640 [Erysipelotrichaceae bacterium]|nr:hypothetical protein [Erysipelotrichaceae bacterium]